MVPLSPCRETEGNNKYHCCEVMNADAVTCIVHWCKMFLIMLIYLFLVQSLGQVGKVLKVYSSGDLRVAVNKRTWTFNPMCLVPAPDASPPDIPGTCEVVY